MLGRNRKVLIGLCLVLCVPARVRAQPASTCLTQADTAAMIVARLQRTIAWSDSAQLANVGLPKVAANQVVLETSNNVCKKAVPAYRQATGLPSTLTAAYVIRVGSGRLVVVHPAHGAGEYWSFIVINSSNYSYIAWTEG